MAIVMRRTLLLMIRLSAVDAVAVLSCMKYLISESKQFGVKNKLHMDSSAQLLHLAPPCTPFWSPGHALKCH